jgi:hypothetical protein
MVYLSKLLPILYTFLHLSAVSYLVILQDSSSSAANDNTLPKTACSCRRASFGTEKSILRLGFRKRSAYFFVCLCTIVRLLLINQNLTEV